MMNFAQDCASEFPPHLEDKISAIFGVNGLDSNDYIIYSMRVELMAELQSKGIVVSNYNKKNFIAVKKDIKCNVNIDFSSSTGNIAVISSSKIISKIRFEGNDHITCISPTDLLSNYTITMRGSSNYLNIGNGCSSNGTEIFVDGRTRKVSIGKDCMFAWGVVIRTSDSHAIFDTKTRKIINLSKDINLDDHIWAGQGALILKGVVLESGSVIAARSIVTKEFPRSSLIAGSPAKIIKGNVSWTRAAEPTGEEIDAVLDAINRIDSTEFCQSLDSFSTHFDVANTDVYTIPDSMSSGDTPSVS